MNQLEYGKVELGNSMKLLCPQPPRWVRRLVTVFCRSSIELRLLLKEEHDFRTYLSNSGEEISAKWLMAHWQPNRELRNERLLSGLTFLFCYSGDRPAFLLSLLIVIPAYVMSSLFFSIARRRGLE